MKKIICSIAMMVFCGASFAQNSAIYKAQAFQKKGEIAEAVKVLDEALANPKTTKFAQMYNLAAELQAQLFNPELMKAAQGLPFDTTAFAATLDKAIDYYIKSHEADIKPDKKGRVEPEFAGANHGRMLSMLDYYNYAAVFMNQCGKKDKSVEYFKKYLDLPKCPIFTAEETDSIYKSKRAAYTQTAMNLAVLYFQDKNYDEALKYVDMASKDTVPTRDLYIIKMQSYLAKNDSTAWLNSLKDAVAKTGDVNFMQNLLFYYVDKNAVDDATKMVNEMVQSSPQNKAAWYMKGCVDLNLKKEYVAARESFEKALELDADFVDANINMAYTYMNEVVAKRMSGEFKYVGNSSKTITGKAAVDAYKKELAQVKGYYEKALPYMEKARTLSPDKPKSWAYALQVIYENLEMKDKKAEIDAVIEGISK